MSPERKEEYFEEIESFSQPTGQTQSAVSKSSNKDSQQLSAVPRALPSTKPALVVIPPSIRKKPAKLQLSREVPMGRQSPPRAPVVSEPVQSAVPQTLDMPVVRCTFLVVLYLPDWLINATGFFDAHEPSLQIQPCGTPVVRRDCKSRVCFCCRDYQAKTEAASEICGIEY